MDLTIEERLAELGIEIVVPPAAVANYSPSVVIGDLLFISGQIPLKDGAVVYQGLLGNDVDIETGQAAARLCAVNVLLQAKAAVGDLERLKRCVRLGGFVASSSEFTDHAAVMNGASDLMVEAMGERGKHCRAAVGCSSLPLGSSVEVEALFQLER